MIGDAPMDEECTPVSSDLDASDLPDFATESATWRTRAHELWLDARVDRDLRAQASAIQAALRGLEHWRNAIEEESRKKEAFQELPDGQHTATIEAIDAAILANRNKNQSLCDVCHSFGDRDRIERFNAWLQEAGFTNAFSAWQHRTPHIISGALGANTP